MKVYIAGKITGDPDYREKFERAARLYRKTHTRDSVLLPSVLPEGMSAADYMRICFAMIDSADRVLFLGDWQSSPGAQLEKLYCEYIGKPTYILPMEKK